MTLFRRLSTPDLIELCRALRHPLSGGMLLRDVMDMLATHGTRRVQLVAADVGKEVRAGWSLRDALERQKGALPPLFISLVAVGEESGSLPEVLAELEKYYALRLKLRREFYDQIAWPVLQFVAAILIVSLFIWVIGLLPVPRTPGAVRIDPLGLGLVGSRGAVIFLSTVCLTLSAAVGLCLLLMALFRRRPVVERALLVVPAIGPCLRAVAISRFCLAGRLMLETSLSVLKTLRLAFLATDNAAFIAAAPNVEASLRRGNSIAFSFEAARVFPRRFLGAVGIGEESGRLPETLRLQAEEYD